MCVIMQTKQTLYETHSYLRGQTIYIFLNSCLDQLRVDEL